MLSLAHDIGGEATANGRDLAGFARVVSSLECELEESRQAYEDMEESAHDDLMSHRRTEQGLQMKIADLLRENGMLKNELRAQAGVIERMRNRTL